MSIVHLERPSGRAPAEGEAWTVLKLILWSAHYLAEKGVGNARLDAEYLLADTLRRAGSSSTSSTTDPWKRASLQSSSLVCFGVAGASRSSTSWATQRFGTWSYGWTVVP